MIKSAVRRRNLVTTSKVANSALEIGAIMVKRTKFNINEYRPDTSFLIKYLVRVTSVKNRISVEMEVTEFVPK